MLKGENAKKLKFLCVLCELCASSIQRIGFRAEDAKDAKRL